MNKTLARRQHILYFAVGGVLLLTAGMFGLLIYSSRFSALWTMYATVYAFMLVAYSWYILILVLIADKQAKHWGELDKNVRFSVIMPCYNEDPSLLARAVNSVIRARGNKEIIIVNDGSVNNIEEILNQLAKLPNIKVHNFDQNSGKREALHYAVKNLLDPTSKYVVTLDSDTVVDEDALVKVLAPLEQEGIAASTGEVALLNEKQNVLTRMAGAYYWVGLHIYKTAQSGLGIVVCCSGCLAAYRADVLKDVIDEFRAQTFFGKPATHSEDRHLTNLILRGGSKVVYVPDAIGYTETPSRLIQFCKQQLRWKRGFVRESLYTLSYSWKNQKKLFFQILFWDLTSTYVSFGLRLYLLFLLIFNPMFVLLIIVPIWAIAVVLRYSLVIIRVPEKTLGLFAYAILFEFLLYWLNIYAFFTARNKKWITRTA